MNQTTNSAVHELIVEGTCAFLARNSSIIVSTRDIPEVFALEPFEEAEEVAGKFALM